MSKLSDFIQTNPSGDGGEIIPPHYVNELHIAKAGQQTFNLLNHYTPGYSNLSVSINGVKQNPDTGTYEETNSKTVTLTTGAEADDEVLFQSLKASGKQSAGTSYLQEVHTATANQTVFGLGNRYQPGAIDVFVNGVLQTPDSSTYSETNALTITLSEGLKAGETVVFKILKMIEA